MVGNGKDRELEAAVEELARADTLAFGGVGFAGTLLPETEAYRRVEQALDEHPDAARKQVDWLLNHGSPAGKAYAATLLDQADVAAGRAAWTKLRNDEAQFTTFTGCLMGRASLREYATERLAGR
ncbi:hypothetical protein ONA91_04305 [Micromonospora sp. DR5-3]|uniref:hypothetical protein n=1 Tax=unclassified Micromonospora TaxID=2617518 RepID=UPI0011DC1DFB|nr:MULTISPECIES: hypothetical protein [unclassified Micromonospora]MCW3813680.1 hypothetical protein [Micromonospora sp. DR5-3]TYC25623.1 hypothetical protein FXF52_04165 [Micromonospora sp. MP36]